MFTHNIIRKGDIREHEINLCLGDSVGENAVTSVRVAYEIAKSHPREGVLFINTFQSEWKFDESCAEAVGPEFVGQARKQFAVVNSQVGELPSKAGTVETLIEDGQLRVGTIVINSWEFASKNSATRERLLFLLMRWSLELGVTVILFAQQIGEREVKAGHIRRSGMGKLMGLVARVVKFAQGEPAEAEAPLVIRLDADSDEDASEAAVITPSVPPVISGAGVRRYSDAIAA